MPDLPDTYVLFPASKRPRTRAQLTAALEPALKDVLARVCLWDDDWNVGDYRFCVLSYDLPDEVHVFLQFWSEPGDPVLWEVSSGKWHPPTEPYMAGTREKRVKAAGFEMGGDAQNYQRYVDVDTVRDVAALAREVTALLYDALDYRSQQALDVQAVADSRATLRPVYASIEPHDLARILELAGYKCEVGDYVSKMCRVLTSELMTTLASSGEVWQTTAVTERCGPPGAVAPRADQGRRVFRDALSASADSRPSRRCG